MYGTIGILTGGGDAPGLNAVIRAVVKTATCEHGMRVIGIEDGFEGLLGATKTRLLSPSEVRGLLPRGGTILAIGLTMTLNDVLDCGRHGSG